MQRKDVVRVIERLGYDVLGASDDSRILIAVSDPGGDSDEAAEARAELRAALPEWCAVEWTGDGNTDSDGETTSDLSISGWTDPDADTESEQRADHEYDEQRDWRTVHEGSL